MIVQLVPLQLAPFSFMNEALLEKFPTFIILTTWGIPRLKKVRFAVALIVKGLKAVVLKAMVLLAINRFALNEIPSSFVTPKVQKQT